jgi:hypothetical protein
MVANPKQKLQPLSEWLKLTFTSPPCGSTARKWCERKIIPAKKLGNSWFVIISDDAELITKRDARLNKILLG